ncbi:hypothetical protein BDV96DRAFT_500907 [Lophiotrema nucula]|uniref:Uncharacterized protein n=1 Tax=Lophiotrema nucula TaxID=690887 RepID=A0A6A5YX02_9PLEO|nr:hypothetical protein BDV96DRAFT_500907 [Lophiotrema nucula]
MLYSVLPAIVQTRIPTLPSIRRSIVDLRGRNVQSKSFEGLSKSETPDSPPPQYTSRAGSSPPVPETADSSDTEDVDFRDDASERPVSVSSAYTPPPSFPLSEAETGISWKYANQGISLLTQAYQESNAVARDANDASAVLTRELYLHSISYLLRGIPSDLTPAEALSIQAAVPAEILSLQNDPNAHALVPYPRNNQVTQEQPPPNPSVLHRITAAAVFQTFVIIQFLLPYIKLFIGHAYRWEQENRVIRKTFNRSIITVEDMGRRSLQLSQTICQMNDGKVGQAINDLTFWGVRGLTGGIEQGLKEGVVVLGAERPQSRGGKARMEKVD